MSLLPLKTYQNLEKPLFAPFYLVSSVKLGPNPVFSTITVENGTIILNSGNYLSTIGGDLYYNNDLIATAGNISSLGDWSIYPAISTVQLSGNDISGVNFIFADDVISLGVSTTTSQAFSHEGTFGTFSSIAATNANFSSTFTASLYATSTISSFSIFSDNLNIQKDAFFSSVNGNYGTFSTLSTLDIITSTFSAEVALLDTIDSSTIVGNLVAGKNALFSTINASTMNVTNLVFVSTFAYVSTISSLQFEGDKGDIDQMVVSSLNGVPISQVITPYSLPNNIVCSTVTANDGISSLGNFYVGSLGGSVKMGGIPDILQTITSYANAQTHGVASGNYTINAPVTDIITNSSNVSINTSNDFTVTAGDINLTQTDATSIFNVTTTGAALMAFGLALDITTGTYLAINSAGNVSIGSGNVLGADTEIEKVGFSENQIYKAGLNDLEIADVSSINGYKYIPTQLWASTIASQTVNMNNNNIISTNNIYTSTITMSSILGASDVNFEAAGSFNMNGATLNMTQGEIHNVPYIHSQNNNNLVIEGKGTGILLLSSLSTVVSKYLQADSIATSSITNDSNISQILQTSSLSLSTIQTGSAGWLSTFFINCSNISTTTQVITGALTCQNVNGNAWICSTLVGSTIQGTQWVSTVTNNTVSTINSVGVISSINTNVISSQQVNVSTVNGRLVTASALVYPTTTVTSNGTNTFTVTDSHTYLINTYGGAGNATWTLPTASSYQGRILYIKNNAATPLIVSNANNVIAQAGGAAQATICAAGTSKFAIIVSDGTNWVVMSSN